MQQQQQVKTQFKIRIRQLDKWAQSGKNVQFTWQKEGGSMYTYRAQCHAATKTYTLPHSYSEETKGRAAHGAYDLFKRLLKSFPLFRLCECSSSLLVVVWFSFQRAKDIR